MMKAVITELFCSRDDGSSYFPEVALGEDGQVYPVDAELQESVEEYEAAVELGFAPEAVLKDDPCLEEFFALAGYPLGMLFIPDALSPQVLGRIAVEWFVSEPRLLRGLARSKRPCNEIPQLWWLAKQYFEEPADRWSPQNLISALAKIDKCSEKMQFKEYMTVGEREVVRAARNLIEMALAFKRKDQQRVILEGIGVGYHMALAVGDFFKVEYGNAYKARRAAQDAQLVKTLAVIDQMDAWNGVLQL